MGYIMRKLFLDTTSAFWQRFINSLVLKELEIGTKT